MYSIFMPRGLSASSMNLLKIGRKAASVLPVPVGAINRTFFPSRIGGIALVWGSVGFMNPFSSTIFLTGLASIAKALFFKLGVTSK